MSIWVMDKLRYSQDLFGEELVCSPSVLPRPFHADLGLVAQPSRTLVATLTEKQIRRGTHRSTRELERHLRLPAQL